MGLTPHVEDRAGRRALAKKLVLKIKALGGDAKDSQSVPELRKILNDLLNKKEDDVAIKEPEPRSKHTFKKRLRKK